MILPPFDSSQWEHSNGGKIIVLWSILTELWFKNFKINTTNGILLSDWISMILPPFDSSHWEHSNGGKIMFLRSILTELHFNKLLSIILTKIMLILARIAELDLKIRNCPYYRKPQLFLNYLFAAPSLLQGLHHDKGQNSKYWKTIDLYLI